jgi:putative resolvase
MRVFNLKQGVYAMTTITEEMLSTKQVAKMFGVSYITVRRWAFSGELKFLKLAKGTIRFRRADVDQFIRDAEQARAAIA